MFLNYNVGIKINKFIQIPGLLAYFCFIQLFFLNQIAYCYPADYDNDSEESINDKLELEKIIGAVEFQKPEPKALEPHPEFGTFEQWQQTQFGKKITATIQKIQILVNAAQYAITETEKAKNYNDSLYRPVTFQDVSIYPENYGRFRFLGQRADSLLIFEATDGYFLVRLAPGETVTVAEGYTYPFWYHDTGMSPIFTNYHKLKVFQLGRSPQKTIAIKGFTPNRRHEKKLFIKAKLAAAQIDKFYKAHFKALGVSEFELVSQKSNNSKNLNKNNKIVALFEKYTSDLNLVSVQIKSSAGEIVFNYALKMPETPTGREFINIAAVADPATQISATKNSEPENQPLIDSELVMHENLYTLSVDSKIQGSCRFGDEQWSELTEAKVEFKGDRYKIYSCESADAVLTGLRLQIPFDTQIKCKLETENISDCEGIQDIQSILSFDFQFLKDVPKIALLCLPAETSPEKENVYEKCTVNSIKKKLVLVQKLTN